MKMKEVVTRTGLQETTVRYYERMGLVQPDTQRRGGRTYHEYSQGDVETLRAVATLRAARFTIEEIKAMEADPGAIPGALTACRSRVSQEVQALTALETGLTQLEGADSVLSLSRALRESMGEDRYEPTLRFGALDEGLPREPRRGMGWAAWTAVAVLGLAVLFLFFAAIRSGSSSVRFPFYAPQGSASAVDLRPATSELFTQAQIAQAEEMIREKFPAYYRDCKLIWLRYDTDYEQEALEYAAAHGTAPWEINDFRIKGGFRSGRYASRRDDIPLTNQVYQCSWTFVVDPEGTLQISQVDGRADISMELDP